MTEQEQERLAIQDTIDEYGCQIMQIPGDNYMPSFAYTIGLHQQNQPEIVCVGLPLEVMQTMLNNVKDRVEDGEVVEAGMTYPGFLDGGVEVSFIEVDKAYYKDYFGYGTWFYDGDDFKALQLIWPDKQGNFPWEPEFDGELLNRQPLLDRNADFKFYEDKNLGIFTSQKVLDGTTIQYVIHDAEGDWFFLENDTVENDDLIMTSLEQIVKVDPTMNSIYHLQYGWDAFREDKDDNWDEQEMPESNDEDDGEEE